MDYSPLIEIFNLSYAIPYFSMVNLSYLVLRTSTRVHYECAPFPPWVVVRGLKIVTVLFLTQNP